MFFLTFPSTYHRSSQNARIDDPAPLYPILPYNLSTEKLYLQRRMRIWRRSNPMLRTRHIALPYWVLVDIVKLLPIEIRIFDLLRCIGIHPEPILSVIVHEQFQNAGFCRFKIALEFDGGIPFEIAQESRHIRGRGDEMNMVQHKNKSIQFKFFVFLAVTQRLGQNLPAIVTVKQVIPTLDCQRQVIGSGIHSGQWRHGARAWHWSPLFFIMFIKKLFSRHQADGIFIPSVTFALARRCCEHPFGHPAWFPTFGTGCIPRSAPVTLPLNRYRG